MRFRGISQEVKIPLFKYYGNVNYAKDAIENSRIHLEPPATYNDIYDSSRRLGEEGLYRSYFSGFLDVNIIRKYCEFLDDREIEKLKKKNISVGEIIDYLCGINEDIDREKFIEESCNFFTQGKNIFQADNNKISCFSEVNDSLLMWAYYAKNYEGICLRFNAPKDPTLSKYCRKVQYSSHYISDYSLDNYFRKSIQWSHEQEWRIVCDTTEQYLPVDSIDAIYVGIRMNKYTLQEFVDIGKRYNLEVYKMAVSDKKYQLFFNKVV